MSKNKMLQDKFSKKIFIVKKMMKVYPMKIVVANNHFLLINTLN